LKPIVFQILDPPQPTLIVLRKLDLFSKFLDDKIFISDVIPFILNCLSSKNDQIQINALNSISHMIPKLSFLTIKVEILPKIAGLFLAPNTTIGPKTAGLNAIECLLPSLDAVLTTNQLGDSY
jgi:hypothetical protein